MELLESMSNKSGEFNEQQQRQDVPDSLWWKLDMTSSERDVLLFSTALKLLLFPTYRSTDFEVHRNWLAITHSLPMSQWYYDTTSQWTLDYPPFFAYFEKFLSIFAYLYDPNIVNLENLDYDSWSVIVFQRTTVVLTELVLGYVLLRFIRGAQDPPLQRLLSASLFLHPGFIIVDHMHFQYNGFLYGILLASILFLRNGNKLAGGFLFAVLLNFKHIYMYLAPAYFVYLLRAYCMSPSGSVLPTRFITLANTVALVFLVSLGPFLLMGQLPQLLSRLFPFTRGLNHAYWAANAWALLTSLDRLLLQYVKHFDNTFDVNALGVASASRGRVGDTVFAILPNITPSHTFVITAVVQSVFLVKLWRVPTYKSFLMALTLCGYTSFMFGWHVHEKAILLILVPLSLLSAESHRHFRTYILASAAGITSLFPLLFTPAEQVIEVLYTILWALFIFYPLHGRLYTFPSTIAAVLLNWLEMVYLTGLFVLQPTVMLFPVVTKSANDNMAFFPLMLTSVYCAVGLLWAYIRLGYLYLIS